MTGMVTVARPDVQGIGSDECARDVTLRHAIDLTESLRRLSPGQSRLTGSAMQVGPPEPLSPISVAGYT